MLIAAVELDETFRCLPLVERLFSVLKEDRKLEFTKHGFERVATQMFLVLIDR